MIVEKNTINYRQLGIIGIFWAIIQILSNFLCWCVTVPASFIGYSYLFVNVYLVFILCIIFDILIIILVIGTFRKRRLFAYFLLTTVFLWLGTEILGLFIKNVSTLLISNIQPIIFWMTNLLYIAILIVILLWMSNGLWNIPHRKLLKPAIFSTLFLFVAVLIIFIFGTSMYSLSGSIIGNIYLKDGTIVSNKVQLRYFSEDVLSRMRSVEALPRYLEKDTQGEYKISGLPQSDNFYIWVVDSSNNLCSDGFKIVQVKRFQETKCDFTLVSSGSISGHLINRSGQFIEKPDNIGQLVFFHDSIPIQFTVYINKDGSFYKTGIMPGKYNFSSEESVIIENSKTTVFNYQIK